MHVASLSRTGMLVHWHERSMGVQLPAADPVIRQPNYLCIRTEVLFIVMSSTRERHTAQDGMSAMETALVGASVLRIVAV
jgi:hypothetical protein